MRRIRSVTKFYNGDIYYQTYDEAGGFNDLYSLSSYNISWLNSAYSRIVHRINNKLSIDYSSIDYKVYMAKTKLMNDINAQGYPISFSSNEFYGMWMHATRVEVAYADAVHLIAQMVQTAVIIGMTVYQTVVTVKSIGTLVNQQKSLNAAGYQAMAKAENSFSNMTNSQAVNEGITDTTSYSGDRRSWRASEMRAAEDYTFSGGYKYNKSYKVVNGNLTEVAHGTAGSQRPDIINTNLKEIVEVKNYNITNSTGKNCKIVKHIGQSYSFFRLSW